MERGILNAYTDVDYHSCAQVHEAARIISRCGELTSRARLTAPDFTLHAAHGGMVRLSTLRDRPVIVTFLTPSGWVSRAQMRALNEVSHYGLAVVLGIATDECHVLRAFADEKDVRFPLLYDADGRVRARYNAVCPPMTFCIDGEGKIAVAQCGLISTNTMLEWLARL